MKHFIQLTEFNNLLELLINISDKVVSNILYIDKKDKKILYRYPNLNLDIIYLTLIENNKSKMYELISRLIAEHLKHLPEIEQNLFKERKVSLKTGGYRFKKINRSSSIDIDKLSINCLKSLSKNDFISSKKHVKELFLRDFTLLKRVLLEVAIKSGSFLKAKYLLQLLSLLDESKKEYLDVIIHIFISMVTNIPNYFLMTDSCFIDSTNVELKSLFDQFIGSI